MQCPLEHHPPRVPIQILQFCWLNDRCQQVKKSGSEIPWQLWDFQVHFRQAVSVAGNRNLLWLRSMGRGWRPTMKMLQCWNWLRWRPAWVAWLSALAPLRQKKEWQEPGVVVVAAHRQRIPALPVGGRRAEGRVERQNPESSDAGAHPDGAAAHGDGLLLRGDAAASRD